jgi:hypothetical protein
VLPVRLCECCPVFMTGCLRCVMLCAHSLRVQVLLCPVCWTPCLPFWVPRLPFDESMLLLQQINVASAAKSSCSENLGGLMVLQLFCSQHCLSMR